jgi:ABC-type polysaccharide/polyol phosphate transport system ATPase subunit
MGKRPIDDGQRPTRQQPICMPPARPAIIFENVHKTFRRNATRTFFRNHLAAWLRHSEADLVHALRDVSFAVQPGGSMAVIGPNGAGKSTLLSLIAGVSQPDRGTVTINGRVAALLALGSGFHPDLTGIENVYLNGSLYGLTRRQVQDRFDAIVEFSGIGDFIHEPLRTYSSGMAVRLAFSVVVHVDPDILIIDEALAVGDQDFQAKCIKKILSFRNAGKTLLCVSHGTEILKQLCDHAVWLDKGRVVLAGNAISVIDAYQSGCVAAQA